MQMSSIFYTGYKSCLAGGIGALIATRMAVDPWGGAAVAATSVLVSRITAPLFSQFLPFRAPDGSYYQSFLVSGLSLGQGLALNYVWTRLLAAVNFPQVFLIGFLGHAVSNTLAGHTYKWFNDCLAG